MILRTHHHLLLHFSSFSTEATSIKWRTQIQQNRLVSQISSLLLQRKHWISLIRAKPNLLANLVNPPLFFQILTRTQTHPEISLEFFKWAQKDLGFHPDLRSHCKMIQTLIESDLPTPAKDLLDPILGSHPASAVLQSMVLVCRSRDSRSSVLSFILEEYTRLGSISQSLETFATNRVLGCLPSVRSCNSLLEALQSSGGFRTAWCFYAAVLRLGTSPDSGTWSVLARLLCNEGKPERAMNLVDLGLCSTKMYSFIIDRFSRKGDFAAAINLLSEMNEKNLGPGFSAYSSVLDGGCRFGSVSLVNLILREMVVRGLVPTVPRLDYDSVVQRFCELGRSYAAEMFFEKAQDEDIALGNGTYMCLLRALSKEGRLKEAMGVYELILEKGATLNPSCCKMFLEGICNGEPSPEADKMVKDVIGRGFVPSTLGTVNLSRYIAAHCSRGRWEEAADVLNLVMEKRILPEEHCCSSLVEHFCADGLVESAIALHDKMKQLGGGLDVKSYDVLLCRLVGDGRIEEASKLFDDMRRRNVGSSLSYSSMITALCHEKDHRKAMKLHDEMLKAGLKPDETTYKQLISGFA